MSNPWMLADPTMRHMHFEPDAEVLAISRWLAHQRAVHRELMDEAAYQLVAGANASPPKCGGAHAAVVAQPRGVVWVVDRLGGDPHLHVLHDRENARACAVQLGADEEVEVILIDLGGEIERLPAPFTPPTLKVAREDDHWVVLCEGRVVATAHTRERARTKARLLKSNPDFLNDPRAYVES